jgi:predicted amidohydrolase YtcJ
VRIVGGWAGPQFAEKRLPTISDLNAAAPDTSVLVLHLLRSFSTACSAASRSWTRISRSAARAISSAS